MQFRAEFSPRPFDTKIQYRDKLFLVGSCFTEEMGNKLARHKFNILQNPHGILFNPISLTHTVISCVNNTKVKRDELFFYNELWHSWDYHSRFSKLEEEEALKSMNASTELAHHFLKEAGWLMVTLGSAFVYETTAKTPGSPGTGKVAANCHKVPTDTFNRRLLDTEEVKLSLQSMLNAVSAINPHAKFIFTISPVRHLREGFVDNNRSKAVLIQAVHSLVDNKQVFYFPAFELILDDLRDYRFYAEDLVHPNYAATQYVWEKFQEVCIDEPSRKLLTEINQVNAARHHKAFNAASNQHKAFLQLNLEKVKKLAEAHPFLNFDADEKYFSGQ